MKQYRLFSIAFVILFVGSGFAKKFDALEPVPKEFEGKYAVSTKCQPELLFDAQMNMTGVRVHFGARFVDKNNKNASSFEWPARQWIGSETAQEHQEDFCVFFLTKMNNWNRRQRKLARERAAKAEKSKQSPVQSAFRR